MNRTQTRAPMTTLTAASVGYIGLPKLKGFWRFGVFLLCLFGVTAFSVMVRLDVQSVRKDLVQNARTQREAGILNDRLRLEMDARRRAVAVEVVATNLELGPDARIVTVEGGQP